jgi:hypothetical protein
LESTLQSSLRIRPRILPFPSGLPFHCSNGAAGKRPPRKRKRSRPAKLPTLTNLAHVRTTARITSTQLTLSRRKSSYHPWNLRLINGLLQCTTCHSNDTKSVHEELRWCIFSIAPARAWLLQSKTRLEVLSRDRSQLIALHAAQTPHLPENSSTDQG